MVCTGTVVMKVVTVRYRYIGIYPTYLRGARREVTVPVPTYGT